MTYSLRYVYFSSLLFLGACALRPSGRGVKPVPKPTEIPVEARYPLEKTFGHITVTPKNGLFVVYKDMQITVNDIGAPGASSAIDYVLVSRCDDNLIATPAFSALRKSQKIIAPLEGVDKIKALGFSNAKGLEAGQKVLLKKGDSFVFVSAVGDAGSGYFLEFDNGRAVFVSLDPIPEETMRAFLYALRDDGKDVTLLFLNYDQNGSEASFASTAALVQPSVVVPVSSNGAAIKQASLKELLVSELFSGEFYNPKPSEILGF